MASTASGHTPMNGDSLLRPRAIKILSSEKADALENRVSANTSPVRQASDSSIESRYGIQPVTSLGYESDLDSGRITPVPPDAPPSTKSISQVRQQLRAINKHRIFPTVQYAPRVSHFDPRSEHRDFKGFFVLFWIGLAIMVITTGLRNIKDTGLPLRVRPWQLFTVNAWQLGLTDFAMVVSTGLVVPMQKAFRKSNGFLAWRNYGMAVHIIFQAAWFTLWINWPFMLRWTWTAQVFLILHTLVFLMKMHSYAFYNGHLGTTEWRLTSLNNPDSASKNAAVRYPRAPMPPVNPSKEAASHDEKAQEDPLETLREDLAMELTSPFGRVTYPQNLTYSNYLDYVFCPTLCYELEYPRTEKFRPMEFFWKALAVLGCVFLMTIISEEYIVPVLSESALRLKLMPKFWDRALILAETISNLLFPFMITFLLVFLVIFEYVLGAFAEMTCFADRQFYSDWWNSCDWLEFSREWNIPVHNFLRRHIYSASLPYMPRIWSTTLTFLVSALLHELIMGCITKKLRGYGFFAMMLQGPIVMLQRSPPLRGKKLLNNICFWCSMVLGLSLMCSLYVLV